MMKPEEHDDELETLISLFFKKSSLKLTSGGFKVEMLQFCLNLLSSYFIT